MNQSHQGREPGPAPDPPKTARKYTIFLRVLIALFGVALLIAVFLYEAGYNFSPPPDPEIDLEALSQPADAHIMLLGNSLSFGRVFADTALMAKLAEPEWDSVRGLPVVLPGYRLIQHADAANDPDRALHQLLVGQRAPSWDVIILQEQSQIPGFAADNPEFVAFLQGGLALHRARQSKSPKATLILMQTWGYPQGDRTNQKIFPDNQTMTRKLAAGYDQLAEALRKEGATVKVAPVGETFLALKQQEAQGGIKGKDALYLKLFQDDRHPTPIGQYFASVVLATTITGKQVPPTEKRPKDLTKVQAARLHALAYEQVTKGGQEEP